MGRFISIVLLASLTLGPGCDPGHADDSGLSDSGRGSTGSDGGGAGDAAGDAGGGAADDGSNSGGSAGAGDSGDGTGNTGDGGGGADPILFEQDVLPIIAANCSCHRGASPSAGLNLADDAAYDSLVGQPSSAGLDYVTPDSADDSYVVHKLDGTMASVGGNGSQMPLGKMLAPADIDTIVAWIESGAG